MKNYNDILVSVVMPVYNGALYLREAIDSILSQTHANLELIIVNDGSIDNSEQIIKSYTDKRIVYLKNEVNSRICVTLNRGLDIAKGKYIARMDCDDISIPDRLSVQVDFMESHPEIGICGSNVIVFGRDFQREADMVQDSDLCTAGLIFNPCFAHPTVMWRKTIMEKYALRYDEYYCGLEDFVMWWRFAEVTKLVNIPKPLLKYRKHENQETQRRSDLVISRSNEFRKIRYQKMGVSLSPIECEVVNCYSYNNFDKFKEEDFYLFVKVMIRILKYPVYPIKTSKKAVKVVVAKAIGYILNQSPQLKANRTKLLCSAFIQGALPFSWFLRFFKSYFL